CSMFNVRCSMFCRAFTLTLALSLEGEGLSKPPSASLVARCSRAALVQSSKFKVQSLRVERRRFGFADCQSAAQQIPNLRYAPTLHAPTL
ncbi:MAG: hypothetical protein N3I86_12070, partial [Verrucomicrobiae bacterium]|nr:hypothetical protein [Verrucomicrobiae bacterium]